MQEKTLVRPLSGPEAREAILYRISQALERDCNFAGHIGISFFTVDPFSFTAHFPEAKTSESTVYVPAAEVGEVDPAVVTTPVTIEIPGQEARSPNDLRKLTDQPIPVAVKEPDGKIVEKRIHYSQPRFRKG